MPNTSSFSAQTAASTVKGVLTDNQIVIPNIPPSGLLAVGNRTSFHFISEPWSSDNTYSYYDVVRDSNGASYVAIAQQVPTGIELSNEEYWFRWSEPNAQLQELYTLVQSYEGRIQQVEALVANLKTANTYQEMTDNGFVYKEAEA